MSDTADRIAKILEDPESLKMISEIAESFMANTGADNQKESEETNEITEIIKDEAETSTYNPLVSITEALQKLVGDTDIENTLRLISAIEPYLSTRRQSGARSVKKTLGLMRTLGNGNISDLAKIMSALNKQ